MRKIQLILGLAVGALGLAGCNLPQWRTGGVTHASAAGSYTVRVPAGWMFLENPRTGALVVTVDGVLLQRAGITWTDLKVPLPYSKRTLAAGTTPLELAEAMADDLRADRDRHRLEIVATEPATIGGVPGFKLVLRFRNDEDLGYTESLHGCIRGERLYLLHFTAPTRHYYERDARTFDELARSVAFK